MIFMRYTKNPAMLEAMLPVKNELMRDVKSLGQTPNAQEQRQRSPRSGRVGTARLGGGHQASWSEVVSRTTLPTACRLTVTTVSGAIRSSRVSSLTDTISP